ncbi:MAG: hypothetical protein JWQ28_2355, partial [Pedobacter sp.]|nr:hypothetical protein [Pedobacter sp.]
MEKDRGYNKRLVSKQDISYSFDTMKQYLVTGYDFKDDVAFERRMNVRPDHINGVKALKQAG